MFLGSWLKMLYSEPRPFWLEPNIVADECKLSFGSPSGHCFLVVASVGIPFMQFYHEYGRAKDIGGVMCTAHIVKMGATCLLAMLLIAIAFSRVYLGVHSWAQVAFGLTLSSSIALSCHTVLGPWLRRAHVGLKDAQGYFSNGKKLWVYNIVAVVVCGFVPLSLLLATYSVMLSENPDFEVQWQINIDRKCHVGATDLSKAAYGGSLFYAASDVGLALGTLTGHFNELRSMRAGSLAAWNQTSFVRSTARFLLLFFLSYLWTFALAFLQKSLGFAGAAKVESPILTAFFFSFLPFFSFSFLIFAFGRVALNKLGLANKDAMVHGDSELLYAPHISISTSIEMSSVPRRDKKADRKKIRDNMI